MGKEIEKLAIIRKHEVLATIDNAKEWTDKSYIIKTADVAIEFSIPDTAADNIKKCFDLNLAVVTGTTGWHDQFEKIKSQCIERNQSLFYSSNFNIGMNIFFKLNSDLQEMIKDIPGYEISIEETHHTEKVDSPSGTAIKLANDIIEKHSMKKKWINKESDIPEELSIKSVRSGDIAGIHKVIYDSEYDSLELCHSAKNRQGFALGAIMAAEWLENRVGVFTMKDMLNL